MQLLTELNKEGTTIVMVTHSKHDASFAHRVINLFDGSIVSSVNESFNFCKIEHRHILIVL